MEAVDDAGATPAAPRPRTAALTTPHARTALGALVLGGPVLAAAVLLLWGLGDQALWRDEVASLTIAHRPLGSMARVIAGHESNMALYDALLHGWAWLGTGEEWLRLPSAACAVAAVPVTMLVAHRVAGRTAAVVAGWVMALNPMVLLLGQQVRGYALALLLAALSALALLVAVQEGGRRRWARWLVSAGVLPYAHLMGGLVVLAQAVALLALARPGTPWRAVARAAGALALAWVPLLVLLLLGDGDRTSWVPTLTLTELRGSLERLSGGTTTTLAVVVLAGAVVAATASGRWRTDRWPQLLLLAGVVVPVVVLAIGGAVTTIWVDRYLVGVLPAVAALVGVGVARLPRGGVPAGIAVVAVMALVGLRVTGHPADDGEDLRAAAAVVERGTRPGDAIAYVPAFARVGLDHYLRRPGRPAPDDVALAETAVASGDLFAREVGPGTLAGRLRSRSRIWVVGYPTLDWHPTPEPATAALPRVLDGRFARVGHRTVRGLDIELLARRASP